MNKGKKCPLLEYSKIKEVREPIIKVEGDFKAMYGEIVSIISDGNYIKGQVLDSSKNKLTIQSLGSISGINIGKTRIKLTGKLPSIQVSNEVLGRVFNCFGEPIDGGPEIFSEEERNISGFPINPIYRKEPSGFIETGISSIDVMNPLVPGQKLPIFSSSGLPHIKLLSQILEWINMENLAIVIASVGLTFDEEKEILNKLRKSGRIMNSTLFVAPIESSPAEKIIAPRAALTAAEYLAFERGMNVVCILVDIRNYCEALREISLSQNEIPGRMGYPGYLFTDLASMFERAGIIKGRKGSLTILPIITMPNSDITHPIPDLTGYITEGQIFLSKDIFDKGIYPPVDVLMSISRSIQTWLKGTREDHRDVANQLYASYSRVIKVRQLQMISGTEALTEKEKKYLLFGERFEREFLNQNKRRTINESLDIAWDILSELPKEDLIRIKKEIKEKYLK